MIRVYANGSGSEDMNQLFIEKVEVDDEVKCEFDHEKGFIDYTTLENESLIGQPVEYYINGAFKKFYKFDGVTNTEHGKVLNMGDIKKTK